MSENIEPKLLLCPFCGGEAKYSIHGEENEYSQVDCCGCGIWFCAPVNADADASKTWNRRNPTVPQWTAEPPKESGLYLAHDRENRYVITMFICNEECGLGAYIRESNDWIAWYGIEEIIRDYDLWCRVIAPPLPEGKECGDVSERRP